MIRYVEGRYGADRVAHIITFGKLQARAALRDVGRVLGPLSASSTRSRSSCLSTRPTRRRWRRRSRWSRGSPRRATAIRPWRG
ncbi:MAG: hypothetical protein R3C69_01295 [Geminicoccaceae bacterium]